MPQSGAQKRAKLKSESNHFVETSEVSTTGFRASRDFRSFLPLPRSLAQKRANLRPHDSPFAEASEVWTKDIREIRAIRAIRDTRWARVSWP